MDFHGFPSMGSYNGKEGLDAPIETFARFQAGFLSSEDFHRFPWVFIDLYGFVVIFMDFDTFLCVSIDFHRFSSIFIDFHDVR